MCVCWGGGGGVGQWVGTWENRGQEAGEERLGRGRGKGKKREFQEGGNHLLSVKFFQKQELKIFFDLHLAYF